MKRKIILLIFSIISIVVLAQKTVTGKVFDEDGKPIPSASVTIEEPGKDAILAYSITNTKGEYKVTFSSSMSTVDLKVKAFNQKNFLKNISNGDQSLNVSMESQATEIQEVTLKTKMITSRGDTISYDLKSFDTKNARTLADVMKNMPGMEVKSDGTVMYQGTAINKFYVNGKDLMEGGYGTVNNSLPKDAVSKIEVMENHQPVKMLQGKVGSEQAAINIKLKKSVTMTGRGEVGSGFGEPWLWNVKLTPMFFGQKAQWVLNYKTNNTGEEVEREGNMLGSFSAWEGRRSMAGQNSWLSVENASVPNLPVKRYLFNNVHYLSANYLMNPFKNKEWELKLNANYTNNAVERESFTDVIDFQNNSQYRRSIENNFYTDKLKGELIFTKNAKKGFFKNTTSFTQFWNADRASVDRGDLFAKQAVESPTSSFQNSLSAIIPWKEKMVNFRSFINYQDDNQTLRVTPSSYIKEIKVGGEDYFFSDALAARQHFRIKSLETSHSANVSFMKKGWTFTPAIGVDYSTDQLNTQFQGEAFNGIEYLDFNNGEYSNNLKFARFVPNVSLGINYKSDAWMLYATVPVMFNNITAEDPARVVNKSLSKVSFTPNAFVQYSFASFWKASVNGSLYQSFGDIATAYAGNILVNPDSFSVMHKDNPIPELLSKSAGARIEYRNPLNNLFFNVNYRLGQTVNNLTSSAYVDDLGRTFMQYIEKENTSDNQNISGEVGKYFPKFKSNIAVNYSNSVSNSESFRNDVFLESRNEGNSIGMKFNNTYLSWLNVDFNFTKSWNQQKSLFLEGDLGKSESYTHNLAVYLYPKDNHSFGFYWDQINSKRAGEQYRNPFFDVSYQYSWAAKKIDFELKWMNIANRDIFEMVSQNVGSLNTTTMKLRPSQVMLTVKFNFK